MRPEVAVMLKTAARVMTSHFAMASGGFVIPSGRLAVRITVRQTATRSEKVRGPCSANVILTRIMLFGPCRMSIRPPGGGQPGAFRATSRRKVTSAASRTSRRIGLPSFSTVNPVLRTHRAASAG